MCLPNILFPVFMFAFIFHCRSFSPCWPLAFLIVSQPLWIFMFFFLQNSSLLFSITRSSSFSVIHVSVNIKNNVEKDTTLLLFFLSKSPGGHVISFQIKPWVAFGLPYLLIELFYIGMPVVQTDGRCTATWLPHFLSYGAPPTHGASRGALLLSLQTWHNYHDQLSSARVKWTLQCSIWIVSKYVLVLQLLLLRISSWLIFTVL